MTTKPTLKEATQQALDTLEKGGMIGRVKAIKTLRTALALSDAQPLTDSEVEQLIIEKHFRKGYVLKESDRTILAWYRLGLRDGEQAHNIKGKQ